MSDLFKPSEATPEALGRLVLERALIKWGTCNVVAIAKQICISPTTMSGILAGRFPGEPSKNTAQAHRKFKDGRLATLTKVCDALELDLDACIAACGLERDDRVILIAKNSTAQGHFVLVRADLEMLLEIVDRTGSLPINVVVHLVKLLRDHKDAS